MQRIVIGSGPDALRAAAVLAARGERVLLLQEGPTASGLRHPELPVETGRMRVPPELRERAEQVMGALVEAPDPELAVAARGRVVRLPATPLGIARLLEPRVRGPALRAWARRRLRNRLQRVLGGGQEERSHRDWVVRRMGGPAWHHLYRDYARRRWGRPSEDLSPALARLVHGTPMEGPFQAVGAGTGAAHRVAEDAVRGAGGEVRAGVRVEALSVVDGRVRAVVLEGGQEIPADAPVWAAASPARVAAWLGEAAPRGLRADAPHLRAQPVLRVALAGDTGRLPDEVHVLDERAPFWRVVRPWGEAEIAIFHFTGDGPEDPVRAAVRAAAELGLGRFSEEGARVERLPDWEPGWPVGTHLRLRRVLLALIDLGVVPVGRAGAFAPLDPGGEVALAEAIAEGEGPDPLEPWRRHAFPDPWRDDLDAAITRLVER